VLRLTVDEQAWRSRVEAIHDAVPGLVPVVKGNGYGFGRALLAEIAGRWRPDELAVGSVHELADVCAVPAIRGTAVISLTPAMHLPDDLPAQAVLTVGNLAHVDALARRGIRGRVAVKLESSMHRHGSTAERLPALLDRLAADGFEVHQFVLHLPLASTTLTDVQALAEVEGWLPHLDRAVPISLGHVSADAHRSLCAAHDERSFRLRSGTALWHGDKASLRLAADVLDVRSIDVGQAAGYRQVPVSTAGHLVMIGAGSSHGVLPLDGGLSPFHFERQRMPLVEAPHMHTSMVVVPRGAPVPEVGDWVDVQRPLTSVTADVVEWR
jgi:alanine racemase